jgi:hypothetical protein
MEEGSTWGCPQCVGASLLCRGVLVAQGCSHHAGVSSSHGGALVMWGVLVAWGLSHHMGVFLVVQGCPSCGGDVAVHSLVAPC